MTRVANDPTLRPRIVQHLLDHGPVLSVPSGRAAGLLADAMGVEFRSIRYALATLDAAGVIERETNGRRTFVIRVKKSAAVDVGGLTPPPPTPSPPLAPEAPTAAPAVALDAGAVAAALLRQVIDAAAAPAKSAHELVEALQRLGEQTAETQRLRVKLRETGDELAAVKLDNEGLRQRAQRAEANVARVLNMPALDAERERTLRELARTMETKPGAYAGNGNGRRP